MFDGEIVCVLCSQELPCACGGIGSLSDRRLATDTEVIESQLDAMLYHEQLARFDLVCLCEGFFTEKARLRSLLAALRDL